MVFVATGVTGERAIYAVGARPVYISEQSGSGG